LDCKARSLFAGGGLLLPFHSNIVGAHGLSRAEPRGPAPKGNLVAPAFILSKAERSRRPLLTRANKSAAGIYPPQLQPKADGGLWQPKTN